MLNVYVDSGIYYRLLKSPQARGIGKPLLLCHVPK